MGEDGEYEIDQVIHGDSVRDVIGYVEYQRDDLYNRLRKKVEKGVQKKLITIKESAQLLKIYEQRLRGYTYLENVE
jgi:arginine decarboxylase